MSKKVSSKPFHSHPQLVSLLKSRGMIIEDEKQTLKILKQVSYYRLSGFWYTCREINRDNNQKVIISSLTSKPERKDTFLPNVTFSNVFKLYLYDKKLRQLMIDAIERIEIHIKTVISHELGFHDAYAYKNKSFINPRECKTWIDKKGKTRNIWDEWSIRQDQQLNRSREDCIIWHKLNKRDIPFWVAVEAWDLGTTSKYYEILNGKYQNRIAKSLGITNAKVLKEWLIEINILRNRCAHHTRIWNQVSNNPMPVLTEKYFQELSLSKQALKRLLGLISIIWFLVTRIVPDSKWLNRVADVIDDKPNLSGCTYSSMGFSNEEGFPRKLFNL